MRVLCCALVLVAAVACSAMGVDRASQSLQHMLHRDYAAGTRVSQLPLRLRVAIAQAAVATDAAANELALAFARAADATDEAAASPFAESAFRFASAAAAAEVDADAAETLEALFAAPELETAAQRMRYRVMKEALMAEAEQLVRAGASEAEAEAEAEGPLSLFGGGGEKKKDKPMMNTGIGSLFGKVADKAKGVATSTPIVGDVVKRVGNVDIHKLSGTVAKVAGAVNTVSGVLSPVLTVATAATAAVPVVGEVVAAATVANTAVGIGSGVVATGAQLVHDNTKEGETLGHALGRAKDYAVAVGNDPTKLARDAVGLIQRKIAECKRDPSICVKLGLTVGSMAASIAGQGGLSKGMKLGANAIGIAQKIKAADDKASGKASGKAAANSKSKGAAAKGKGKGAGARGAPKRAGKGRAKLSAAKTASRSKAQGKPQRANAKANGKGDGLLWAGPDQSGQQQQKPDVLSAVQQIMA